MLFKKSNYDITNNTWNYMNCSISKDLHCWEMSISFVPIGKYKTYDFLIGVKSTMLKDLKYEKQSDTSNLINWSNATKTSIETSVIT